MDKFIIQLTDNNGNVEDYELLDLIKFEGNVYTVFYPTKEGDTEVTILKVEISENPDETIYAVVNDQRIINEVYKMFKEKYKDTIQFND